MSIRIIPTEFSSEGETVRGNFVIPEGEGAFPGILKFHGLPGSSDQVSGIATRLAKAGFAVLTFDFRGFRSSDGYFSLAGEIKDAHAALKHFIASGYISPEWLGIYTASYGATVAIIEAIDNPFITAVVLRAPVYDPFAFAQSTMVPAAIEELLRTSPDIMHGLTDSVFRAGIIDHMIQEAKIYNAMNAIQKLTCPLFIITGDADKGIDLAGVKRLFEVANEPKELVIIPGADHNLTNPVAFEQTMVAIVAWFKHQFIYGDYLGI
ncbi:MAG: alpha/beta hydrolase [Promethearchaeota archaeon]